MPVKTCERCKGNGMVGQDAVFSMGPVHLVIECPACKGKGFVQVKRQKPRKGKRK